MEGGNREGPKIGKGKGEGMGWDGCQKEAEGKKKDRKWSSVGIGERKKYKHRAGNE